VMSIITNTAGTNTKEGTVAHKSPPITAYAVGVRNSPPASCRRSSRLSSSRSAERGSGRCHRESTR
jgi:hypothetical protein